MSNPLQPYRTQIDDLDEKILNLLAQRFEIVRKVGELKTSGNIEIIQSERAQNVIDRAEQTAKNKGVPPALIRNFYTAMIEEAHKIEFAIQEASQAKSLYGKDINTAGQSQHPSGKESSNA